MIPQQTSVQQQVELAVQAPATVAQEEVVQAPNVMQLIRVLHWRLELEAQVRV